MEANGRARSRLAFVVVGSIAAAVLAASVALGLRLTGNDSVVLPGAATYSEAVAGTWQRVNPLFVNANEVDADLAGLVFSGLVRVDREGRVVPDLAAELPEVTDGGTTYTFRIRANARWHDGEPVTSRDVAFTVRLLQDPDFDDPAMAEGWNGVTVETPDLSTVVIRLRQPSAPFLARSATVGVLPEHLLGGKGAQELENDPFNARPVGSGPYRLESLDASQAVLTANTSYYLGRPGIDRIVLKFYPDEPQAIRAFAAGETDGLYLRGPRSQAELDDVSEVDGKRFTAATKPVLAMLYLNNTNSLFRDERVRQALSLAIDRDAIVREVFNGVGKATASPIVPGTWAYDGELDDIGVNVTRARQLLEEAGWQPHPTTGILVREGQEFRFTIRTDNAPERVALANAVAKQLEAIGVRATVASTTFSVLRRDFLQERKYEAAVVLWDQGADPDLYFGWHSSQLGAAGLNLANFEDAVMDELIARGRTSTDSEIRLDSYRQVQDVWRGIQPSIVLAATGAVVVHPEWLREAEPGVLFTSASRFFDVHRWRR
ncbi:MAG: peptide-binding protein [Tepidiforma sp.]|nr:MAG: peptide-binding protein [Tepidiforma sp.]